MKYLLPLAALAEGGLGILLLACPSIVLLFLLGVNLDEVGATGELATAVARVTGIALIALATACWPGVRPLTGMLTYSTLVALYLALLGFQGDLVGVLLWPGVALHLIFSLLMARTWLA